MPAAPSHDDALAACRRLVGVLRLLNLADEELKSFGYVLPIPGTSLGPGAVVLVCQSFALLGRHLALLRTEIALVADNADGDGFGALGRGLVVFTWDDGMILGDETCQVVENLVADDLDHLEGGQR